jgi:hypothetical protein
MSISPRHRLLNVFEMTLLVGVLLGQGVFLLSVIEVAAGVAV